MSTQLTVVNDSLNLLRGKSIRFILEDADLRMIKNLVELIDEMDLVYDQEKMIYVDPHNEKRGKICPNKVEKVVETVKRKSGRARKREK